jgi:hypothetical protein
MARYSLYSFVLCATIIVLTAFVYYPRWQQSQTEATISWDVSGYYLYLPAAIIYGDMKNLAFFPEIEKKYHPGPGMGQAFQHEKSGHYVMKYSGGQALQFLPWFAVAHVLAEPLGYPADGFSLPYQAAISWGSLLIALLGLWLARSNLLRYFSDKSVAIALFCLVWGTNYLNYTAIDGAMTHNWLFTLYNLLIFSTIKYYEKPSFKWAALIGLWCGWATLTRPTEIISIIIPILWGVAGWAAFKDRLRFLWNNRSTIVVAKITCAVMISLQVIYWKWASGEWIVYSYQDQGFDWKHPHIADVFFSFKAGWLTYSPMMIFAIIGLWAFWKRQKALFPAVMLFLTGFTYITCAWSIWWYGGSLGARAMVQSYALWLFPMASLAEWAITRKWTVFVLPVLCGFFIWHSLWWTHQAHKGGLFIAEQMTNRYFWKVYGQEKAEKDWLKFLDKADNYKGTARQNIITIWENNFETDTVQTTTEKPVSGTRSLCIDAAHPFSPKFVIPKDPQENSWLRLWFTIRCAPKEYETWKMTQAIFRFTNGATLVKDNMIRPQRLVDGEESQRVFMDIKQPRKSFTGMELYFWNPGSTTTVYIDDISVEQFQE